MQCKACEQPCRKFGKDRYGNQRFQCLRCRTTYSDRPAKPLDEMRLPLDKAVQVLKLLTEGCSVRSTVRLTGVAKDTILALLVVVGQKCATMMQKTFTDLPVNDIQVDETWGYVGCKERVKKLRHADDEEKGDAYCFYGIERDTKLIIAWHLGKRSNPDTHAFIANLNRSIGGRFQLSTDGFGPYPEAIALGIEKPVDYGQIHKKYGKSADDHKYSPPKVIKVDRTCCYGNPDPDKICTSHIERSNLTIRMSTRRMTRLTNAFSKKWLNHWCALAIHFAFYNFCRNHSTLKRTPAMAANLTDHVWTLQELLEKSTH